MTSKVGVVKCSHYSISGFGIDSWYWRSSIGYMSTLVSYHPPLNIKESLTWPDSIFRIESGALNINPCFDLCVLWAWNVNLYKHTHAPRNIIGLLDL